MIHVKEFKCRQEVEDFLQGKIVGTVPIDPYVGVNVRGLTLVFTTPLVTVTFPDEVAWESAKLNDIVEYINTETTETTASVRSYGYGHPSKTSVIALVKELDELDVTSTALEALGLVAGVVGAAKVLKAAFLGLDHNNTSNMFFLTYDL